VSLKRKLSPPFKLLRYLVKTLSIGALATSPRCPTTALTNMFKRRHLPPLCQMPPVYLFHPLDIFHETSEALLTPRGYYFVRIQKFVKITEFARAKLKL
jgi:hypothetical protein